MKLEILLNNKIIQNDYVFAFVWLAPLIGGMIILITLLMMQFDKEFDGSGFGVFGVGLCKLIRRVEK